MTLSAPHLLVSVVSPLLSADPGGLRGLGVGNTRAGQRVLTRAGPHPLAKRRVEPLEGPVRAPPPEPPVNGLPRQEVPGQQPPGTAAFEDIEDRVEDLAGSVGLRPSSLIGRWGVRLYASPLSVRKIGRIAPLHARERTSSTYPTRFSKQFQKGFFSETEPS